MLLPEPQRSTLPFVASLALQSSFLLVLAIPWTVQTLRNSIQSPSVLIYQPLKPVEPPASKPIHDVASNSIFAGVKHVPSFHFPIVNTQNPAAPELTLDSGMYPTFSGAAPGNDVSVPSGLQMLPPPKVQVIRETQQQQAVVVGGKVQAAKLIRQVQPVYPPLACQARVQGVVTLEAIIGTDGAIQQLRVMSGHPLLIRSAVQAVQQWKYLPTVLNDKEVEVKTTIEVRFTLS